MKKDLRFGGVCLNDYISPSKKSLTNTKKEKIIEFIKEKTDGELFNTERGLLANLAYEAESYKKIDLSFLKMYNIRVNHINKNYESFPRFTVHKRSKEGFDPFKIEFFYQGSNYLPDPMFFKLCDNTLPKTILKNLRYAILGDSESMPFDLNNKDELIHSIKGFEKRKFNKGLTNPPKPGFWGNLNGHTDYSFTTSFNGFIPQKTKEKIRPADKIFGRDLFLIKETKLEEWKVNKMIKLVKDPLIVGTINDNFYLIDHFDCTPLEHYIKSEFTT